MSWEDQGRQDMVGLGMAHRRRHLRKLRPVRREPVLPKVTVLLRQDMEQSARYRRHYVRGPKQHFRVEI